MIAKQDQSRGVPRVLPSPVAYDPLTVLLKFTENIQRKFRPVYHLKIRNSKSQMKYEEVHTPTFYNSQRSKFTCLRYSNTREAEEGRGGEGGRKGGSSLSSIVVGFNVDGIVTLILAFFITPPMCSLGKNNMCARGKDIVLGRTR